MSICDLVKDCIENDPGVIEAIQEIIREQGPIEDSEGEDADYEEFERVGDTSDDLDCVYGALRDAYNSILVPAWVTLSAAITAATDFAGVIQELPFVSTVASSYIDAIDSLLVNGTALYNSHILNVGTVDNVVCEIFDRICERGEPYRLRNEDITAGIAKLGEAAPIPFVNQLIGQIMNRQTFAAYWKRRTDEVCSNDWELICDCDPNAWTYTIDAVNFPGEGTLDNAAFVASEQAYRPIPASSAPPSTVFVDYTLNFVSAPNTVINGVEMETRRVGSYVNRSQIVVDGSVEYLDLPPTSIAWVGDTGLSVNGASSIEFKVAMPYNWSQNDGIYLYRVRISGTGTNPFVP